LKFVERVERCWLGCTPASIACVFTLVLLFFPIAFAEAAVETYREGVSGYSGTQDTFLEEETPDTTREPESLVKVDKDPPQVQHSLIRFDNIFGSGAGQTPLGPIIHSATLTVDVANTSSGGAQIRLHHMLVTWPETATWNSMTNGIQRDDVEAMSAHDAQVADPASTGPEVITGLTAVLRSWSDGATNYGWALVNNSADGWDVDSSENGSTATRPLLTVNWTPGICPGGNVTATTDSIDSSSLRACVIWSNANSGTDTITVPAGTYTLTLAGTGEHAAATGDLDITDDVVITGNATALRRMHSWTSMAIRYG